MKAPIRILMISLVLGLAGAVTAAFGAESVIALISQGEAVVSKVKTTKAASDDVVTRNKQLNVEGKQIVAEQEQIKAAVADYNQQNDAVKQQITDYKSKCEKKQLNQTEYNACKTEIAAINQKITAVNAIPPKLNKQQSAWQARAEKYNQDIKDLNTQNRTSGADYQNALAQEEQWLDQARQFTASAAVQPYAKKSGCPDPNKVARSINQVMEQSTGFLACLKKIAGTN